MDEVKFGEILLPGDEDTQSRREKTVRQKFWPTFRRAVRQIPFSRDVVAGFYCALDPQTPTKVRGVLLAALAYFVMPVDMIPDILPSSAFPTTSPCFRRPSRWCAATYGRATTKPPTAFSPIGRKKR